MFIECRTFRQFFGCKDHFVADFYKSCASELIGLFDILLLVTRCLLLRPDGHAHQAGQIPAPDTEQMDDYDSPAVDDHHSPLHPALYVIFRMEKALSFYKRRRRGRCFRWVQCSPSWRSAGGFPKGKKPWLSEVLKLLKCSVFVLLGNQDFPACARDRQETTKRSTKKQTFGQPRRGAWARAFWTTR